MWKWLCLRLNQWNAGEIIDEERTNLLDFLKISGGGRDYIKISCNFVGEKYYNRIMNPLKTKHYGKV